MESPRRENGERAKVPNAKQKPDLAFLESGLFVDRALLSLILTSFLSFIQVRTLKKNKEKDMLLSWLTVFTLATLNALKILHL